VKKTKIANRLAEQSNITRAAAADELDRVVNTILQRLRSGQSASLPGLGTFRSSGGELKFHQEPRARKATNR